MTCDLSQTELHFPGKTLRIRPYTVNYHMQLGQLDYSVVELSIEAGKTVAELGEGLHPVEIMIGDERLCRLSVDAADVSRSRERANVRLRDPRMVLEQGLVSVDLPQATLAEAVEHIWKSIDDPHGVLTGYAFTDPEYETKATERQITAYGAFKLYLDTLTDPLSAIVPVLKKTKENFIEEAQRRIFGVTADEMLESWKLTRGLRETKGGVRFEEISPLDALTELGAQFNVSSHVDDEGTLWIGSPETFGTPYDAGTNPSGLVVNQVNIFEGYSPIRGVILEGKYADVLQDESIGTMVSPDPHIMRMFRGRVTAKIRGASDGRIVRLDPVRVESLEDLKMQAVMAFREHAFKEKSGNIEVLPLAGDYHKALALDIGDHIWLLPQVDCHRETPGGLYGVRGLVHRINSRDGWKLSVTLGKLVPDKEIELTAFVSNVETDGKWVNANDYYNQTFSEN